MDTLLSFYQYLPSKISPNIFTIGSFQLKWYSMGYIFACVTACLIAIYRIKHEKRYQKYTSENVLDFVLYSFVGIILGGRLGYVIFYNPDSLFKPHLIFFPFRDGQFVGISGMSYHGGMIGVIVAYLIFIKIKKIKDFSMMDLLIPGLTLGYTWGRLGNFVNGELYGRITEQPWGMYFYEFVFKNGEFIKQSMTELRHPSQLYEAFFEGIVLFLILWFLRKKNWQPGMLSCVYLIGYGFFRFFIEYFRSPDKHIGFVVGKFTMGQVLCFSMFLVGVFLFFWFRRKGKKMLS